jgi:deazaflavin-dependent oxidoreductase (nitroreductase family)
LNEIQSLAREQFCYLTTTGRKTGKPHTVEIWFAMPEERRTLFILSSGRERSDWVRNILCDPTVEVRIAEQTFGGCGRIINDGAEEHLARRLVVAKYYGRNKVRSTGWEATSLPIAIDLE